LAYLIKIPKPHPHTHSPTFFGQHHLLPTMYQATYYSTKAGQATTWYYASYRAANS